MAFAPAIGIALAIAGIGLSAIGSIQQGQSNAAAATYQSQVADRNKQINLVNAQRAIARSRAESQQVEEQNRALYGAQEAAQSASGLSLFGRSQILTRKSARELGRRDVLNVRQAGEVEAYNFQMAAQDNATQSDFLQQQASDSALAGWLGAASAVVGGLSSPRFAVPGAPNLTDVKPFSPRLL